MPNPYTAAEVAAAIGITLDTFYRTRQWRHDHEALPRPISERGKLAFERGGMDAWLTRHHPLRAKALPANDLFAVPEPASDAEHRARLAAAYAPSRRSA